MKSPRPLLTVTILATLSVALAGCGLVYKLPTRQGNVIEQKDIERVEMGMTRSQIRFLLGTPLAASPFSQDRWDYLGYYRSPRGKTTQRVVSFHFEGDQLARAEGLDPDNPEAAEIAEPEAVREDVEAFGSPLPSGGQDGPSRPQPPQSPAPRSPNPSPSPTPAPGQ